MEPSLGHGRCGSLQWLPARVMSDLRTFPDGIPSGAAAAKTPATPPTARHGPYLLVRLRVRPERHRAQSCAIALRSPAPERSSDRKRYSPDIRLRPGRARRHLVSKPACCAPVNHMPDGDARVRSAQRACTRRRVHDCRKRERVSFFRGALIFSPPPFVM